MDGMNGESMFELRFQKEAQSLRERYGIGLDDLTAWEVAQLVHAVERICAPFSDVNAELAERPVNVCGVWLWPVTVGAQLWLDEYAGKWWKPGSRMQLLAIAYAMRNARNADAFIGLTERCSATMAVLRSALTLPVRMAELYDAICRANGAHIHDAPPGKRSRAEKLREQAQTDFASIVARLEVESGIPRSVWLWERSLMYTFTAYAELHEFASVFSDGCGRRARMLDALDDALKNLALVKREIVSRVKLAAEKADLPAQEPHGNADGDDGDKGGGGIDEEVEPAPARSVGTGEDDTAKKPVCESVEHGAYDTTSGKGIQP